MLARYYNSHAIWIKKSSILSNSCQRDSVFCSGRRMWPILWHSAKHFLSSNGHDFITRLLYVINCYQTGPKKNQKFFSDTNIACKMNIYMWIGLERHKEVCFDNFPPAFKCPEGSGENIPTYLYAEEQHVSIDAFFSSKILCIF